MSPLYVTAALLTLFLMADWASLILNKPWFKISQKVVNTSFFLSVAWLAVDFAHWVGQSNIFIIGLIDQAVRFLQHTQ